MTIERALEIICDRINCLEIKLTWWGGSIYEYKIH